MEHDSLRPAPSAGDGNPYLIRSQQSAPAPGRVGSRRTEVEQKYLDGLYSQWGVEGSLQPEVSGSVGELAPSDVAAGLDWHAFANRGAGLTALSSSAAELATLRQLLQDERAGRFAAEAELSEKNAQVANLRQSLDQQLTREDITRLEEEVSQAQRAITRRAEEARNQKADLQDQLKQLAARLQQLERSSAAEGPWTPPELRQAQQVNQELQHQVYNLHDRIREKEEHVDPRDEERLTIFAEEIVQLEVQRDRAVEVSQQAFATAESREAEARQAEQEVAELHSQVRDVQQGFHELQEQFAVVQRKYDERTKSLQDTNIVLHKELSKLSKSLAQSPRVPEIQPAKDFPVEPCTAPSRDSSPDTVHATSPTHRPQQLSILAEESLPRGSAVQTRPGWQFSVPSRHVSAAVAPRIVPATGPARHFSSGSSVPAPRPPGGGYAPVLSRTLPPGVLRR